MMVVMVVVMVVVVVVGWGERYDFREDTLGAGVCRI
jgi:hypothetical protein